jgi:alanine racemase
MNSLCTAEISLRNIGHNLGQIRKRTRGRKVMVAVKANAYGHGLVPVAKYLEKLKVDFLAVAFDTEGVELRQNGIRTPILVLTAVSDYRNLRRYGLTPTVYSFESLRRISRVARGSAKRMPVHLDIDTGMGRIGIAPDQAAGAIGRILSDPGLRLEGVFTHLSSSDDRKDAYTRAQLARFDRVLALLAERGAEVPLVHAANSGGIVNFAASHFTMVRPGIAVYGCSPDNKSAGGLDLRPALSLRTRIFHLKTIARASGIGYNHTYTARKGQDIATIPVGYGDGYNRLLSNRGRAIVEGRWAPVVGRVSMDQTTLDVTRIPAARIGSEVVLIGRSGAKSVTAEQVAELTGTICYEALCALSPRVQRVYAD